MYAGFLAQRPAFAEHIRVLDISDVGALIKTQELVTDSPGRKFVVGGADRIAYDVRCTFNGYELRRIDAAGALSEPQLIAEKELQTTAIGHAIRLGVLFTPALSD